MGLCQTWKLSHSYLDGVGERREIIKANENIPDTGVQVREQATGGI